MAFNKDRFVIIDGVQINKARAIREGLVDDKGKIIKPTKGDATDSTGPSSSRARTSDSTRRKSGSAKATEAPADDDDDAADDDTSAAADDDTSAAE